MTFENGGISDKQGNAYENRYLARVLIRLLAEEITSVVVEPVGKYTDVCEFYITEKDGRKIYYQCKGSNGTNDHWRPSDLQRYDLFSRVQKLLRSDPNCKFCFVSPLYYDGLDIVIEKAPIAWCTPNSFWLMSRDLQALEEYYFPYLKKASDAPNPELVTRVARLICATAIITSSEQVLSFLYSHPWSKEAMDKICLEAASTFDKEEYRMTSQRIIEHLLEIDANSLHSINQLFQEKRLDLRRDKSFITAILKKRHDIETTNDFIEFIKTQDTEISGFAETIKTAVQSFDEKAHTWQKRQIEDGLVHAVIKLIDTANGDKELKECCLDILDEIYKKRILTDSAVSKLIEGVD